MPVEHSPVTSGVTTVIRALDSPLRLEILHRLYEREHFVYELIQILNKSQPLISQHLRVLKQAGIVDSTRSGREVVYRLIEPEAMEIVTIAAKIAP